MGQSDGAINPEAEIFHVTPVNPLPSGRQNQTHAASESTLVLILHPESLHGDMHYIQYM